MIKAFWESRHEVQDEVWLTGSSLWEVKHYHSLENTDFADLLEIGVGTGSLIQEIRDRKIPCKYIGCDIVDVPSTEDFYNTGELSAIRPVKLALAHLVFQHCEPEEVERIINDVQLTKDGLFSFQIAVLRDEKPSSETSKYKAEGKLYFTTLEEMKNMIKRSNKKLIWQSESFSHDGRFNFDWYILKVGRKT